ncbi:MAG: hypothetical protein ABSE69_12945, partial [Roseiarcus sp.]
DFTAFFDILNSADMSGTCAPKTHKLSGRDRKFRLSAAVSGLGLYDAKPFSEVGGEKFLRDWFEFRRRQVRVWPGHAKNERIKDAFVCSSPSRSTTHSRDFMTLPSSAKNPGKQGDFATFLETSGLPDWTFDTQRRRLPTGLATPKSMCKTPMAFAQSRPFRTLRQRDSRTRRHDERVKRAPR